MDRTTRDPAPLAGAGRWKRLRRQLPKDIFYFSTVPVKMYPAYFVIVTVASLAMCLLATIYPARQAARVVPVDNLRYE